MANKLSVVMCAYNDEDYVGAAVESVLGQTYGDFDYIIVNDGSSDGTLDTLQGFAKADKRITIISRENGGTTKATVTGMNAATSDYVARMDADDLCVPDRFERQVAVLDARPECVAVTSHFEHFHDDGKIKMVSDEVGPEELIGLYNGFANRIGGHGQVMFRRDAYLKAGGYDPHFRYSQDYDLWCRLLHLGRFAVIEDILYRWRVGYGSTTDKNKEPQLRCATQIACREHERLTGTAMTHETALALIGLWWARKPEQTPMSETIKASRAMNRAVNSYFAQNPDIARFEHEARMHIARTWKWRIPLAGKANLARRALLLGHAAYWRLSALGR